MGFLHPRDWHDLDNLEALSRVVIENLRPTPVPPAPEPWKTPLSSPNELPKSVEQPDRNTRLETQAKIRERRFKCDFPE